MTPPQSTKQDRADAIRFQGPNGVFASPTPVWQAGTWCSPGVQPHCHWPMDHWDPAVTRWALANRAPSVLLFTTQASQQVRPEVPTLSSKCGSTPVPLFYQCRWDCRSSDGSGLFRSAPLSRQEDHPSGAPTSVEARVLGRPRARRPAAIRAWLNSSRPRKRRTSPSAPTLTNPESSLAFACTFHAVPKRFQAAGPRSFHQTPSGPGPALPRSRRSPRSTKRSRPPQI